jgi:hypothetical protein
VGYFKVVGVLLVGVFAASCDSSGSFMKTFSGTSSSAQSTNPGTTLPTSVPTTLPTTVPTSTPSATPSKAPTSVPTTTPTTPPTTQPTANPSSLPPSGAGITPSGTLWYVRTDGGTAAQCNGKTDHALAGASGQNCAFSNPHYLWGNDTAGETAHWKIAGGDTVILRQGPYRIGYKGPNSGDSWGQCQGSNTSCTMPPIPAGSANVHTKFLGENYANCTTKTQLHGGYGLNHIIDLTETQHVDVACLELTDYSQCSRLGSAGTTGVGTICNRNFPVDDYADIGILTDIATTDVSLIDLDIHGIASSAINGAIGTVVNVNHVRMHANGDAGWNFDDGNDDPMGPNAQVNAAYLTVEYSGCIEEYPIKSSNPTGVCYDQAANYTGFSNGAYTGNTGNWAYGDGVGTSDTMLSFTCDHCNFNHNTQDGFDLLHTSGSVISITNSTAYANEGQQFKLGPMNQVTFKDNVVIGNCHRMAQDIAGNTPGYNAGVHDVPDGNDITDSRGLCRADATAMSLSFNPGGNYVFQNNTLVAYGDIAWSMNCPTADCTGANITFENNVSVAYPYPNSALSKQMTALNVYPGITNSNFTRSNNIYYNFRNPVCPSTFGSESCVDPMFVSAPNIAFGGQWTDETIFDNMDLHLQSSSPAKGTGLTIPGLTLYYDGTAIGSHFDMGAF